MCPMPIDEIQTKKGVKYLVAVCIFLLVAAGVLGQLWLIERDKRMTAERRVTELYYRYEIGRTTRTLPALDRTALPRRSGRLDDKPVTLLEITSAQAMVLGLKYGDVLVVAPADDSGDRAADNAP